MRDLGQRVLWGIIAGAWAMGACSADTTEQVGREKQPILWAVGAFYNGDDEPPNNETIGGTFMHVCPLENGQRTMMVGAHIGQNVWKCVRPLVTLGTPHLDTGTIRSGMHACPFGEVLVGMHVGQNKWACARPSTPIGVEYTDPVSGGSPSNDTYPMHVCNNQPVGLGAMTGAHIGNNVWLCGN